MLTWQRVMSITDPSYRDIRSFECLCRSASWASNSPVSGAVYGSVLRSTAWNSRHACLYPAEPLKENK